MKKFLNMTCELINLETSEDDYVHVYLALS